MDEITDENGYRPRLFVGGLKGPCEKDDLRHHFEEFGEVKDVWIAYNPPGYAFVEFTTMEAAKEAKEKMHLANILGTEIRVELTKRVKGDRSKVKLSNLGAKPRLFVGGLKNEPAPDEIKELFQSEGEVTDVYVAEGKGYAFVEFASMAHAKNAKAKYDKGEYWGNTIRIEMSQKKNRGGGRQGPYPMRGRGYQSRGRRGPLPVSYYDDYYGAPAADYSAGYGEDYYAPPSRARGARPSNRSRGRAPAPAPNPTPTYDAYYDANYGYNPYSTPSAGAIDPYAASGFTTGSTSDYTSSYYS